MWFSISVMTMMAPMLVCIVPIQSLMLTKIQTIDKKGCCNYVKYFMASLIMASPLVIVYQVLMEILFLVVSLLQIIIHIF